MILLNQILNLVKKQSYLKILSYIVAFFVGITGILYILKIQETATLLQIKNELLQIKVEYLQREVERLERLNNNNLSADGTFSDTKSFRSFFSHYTGLEGSNKNILIVGTIFGGVLIGGSFLVYSFFSNSGITPEIVKELNIAIKDLTSAIKNLSQGFLDVKADTTATAETVKKLTEATGDVQASSELILEAVQNLIDNIK